MLSGLSLTSLPTSAVQFSKYVLSFYHVLSPVLGAGDPEINRIALTSRKVLGRKDSYKTGNNTMK